MGYGFKIGVHSIPIKDAILTLSAATLKVTGAQISQSITYEYSGDGTVTARSSNEAVCTATVSEKKIKVTYVTAGTATIYVSAPKTKKYKECSASFTVTTVKSTPTINLSAPTLNIYGAAGSGTFTASGTGDGTLSVSSGNTAIATAVLNGDTVTVNYISAGSCSIIVTKSATARYNAASATVAVTCQKSASAVSLSAYSGTLYGATGSMSFTVSGQTGDGGLSVASSNTSVATVSLSGTTVNVTYVGAGSATITVSKAETAKYTGTSATYSLTCARTTVTIPSLASTSIAWSGSTVTVGVNNYNSSLMNQTGTTSANSVGTWTVSWSLKNTAKYCWTDGSSGTKSATWSTYAQSVTFYIKMEHSGGGSMTGTYAFTTTARSWSAFTSEVWGTRQSELLRSYDALVKYTSFYDFGSETSKGTQFYMFQHKNTSTSNHWYAFTINQQGHSGPQDGVTYVTTACVGWAYNYG